MFFLVRQLYTLLTLLWGQKRTKLYDLISQSNHLWIHNLINARRSGAEFWFILLGLYPNTWHIIFLNIYVHIPKHMNISEVVRNILGLFRPPEWKLWTYKVCKDWKDTFLLIICTFSWLQCCEKLIRLIYTTCLNLCENNLRHNALLFSVFSAPYYIWCVRKYVTNFKYFAPPLRFCSGSGLDSLFKINLTSF